MKPQFESGMRTDLGHDYCTADMMDRCNNSRCAAHGLGPAGSFARYSNLAARTFNPDMSARDRSVNAALGIAGESGELIDEACKGLAVAAGRVADDIKKDAFRGVAANREKIRGEVGDVLWYLNQLCRAFDLSLGECADANIAKLEARYPGGFVKGGGIR